MSRQGSMLSFFYNLFFFSFLFSFLYQTPPTNNNTNKATTKQPNMSEQQPPSYDDAADSKPAAMIEVVLTIPKTTISQVTSATSEKKFIGTGELKVYSTSNIPSEGPSSSPASAGGKEATKGHHHTTFMTLETNDTPTGSYKSLVTHPLMPSSTGQKTGDYTWRFSVPGSGYLEVQVPE